MEINEDSRAACSALAREVITLSRNQLIVKLRFLDAAISRLTLNEMTECPTYATDGKYLAYNPIYVLRSYKRDRAESTRDYLHVLMHCIFRHMFIHTLVYREVWDLACDIAVEFTISCLGLQSVAAGREAAQKPEFSRLQTAAGGLTAEKLYRYFLDSKLSHDELVKLRLKFVADDHVLWYMSEKEKEAAGYNNQEKAGGNNGEKEDNSTADSGLHGRNTSNSGSHSSVSLEEDWKSVSEHIQMDMETFSKSQGSDSGALIQNLREVNRERHDFSAFLRRFAILGEVMKINPDEFDYVFYTYGLKLYGNVPLIEPLEYRETKRIREFVIAIDTSGSVAGDTVQRFVEKSWNILKTAESFFTKINLHIIQCDADIQEDKIITSQEEFDEYIKTMQIHGLGGTDFRPVFTYVDGLIEKKHFLNLKGLIYLTDGWGTFPEHMPVYKTAFVFLDDGYNNYDVPPWAIKLILSKDDI